MSFNNITDIAVSGMMAQRTRIAITASNLANAETTRTAEGGAYRRRDPVFVAESPEGPFAEHLERELRAVRVASVAADSRDFIERIEPGHPDADENGVVRYPRINTVEEMTNLMSASRSFDANLMMMGKVRQMSQAVLKIGG
ncbi:MAG: flagellar basal body rod protein FlgC [Myxococcota bacterium]|jgi:flagellar basal-body rod protein FlgC|nr:flagellar basal body rod protein FlgC [Myxococcota bacterium]